MRRAEHQHFAAWRSATLSPVTGEVIEIGAGTGVNIAHYPSSVRRLHALEPSCQMRELAVRKSSDASFPITWGGAYAESLSAPNGSYDWAVSTLVLCSVRDPERALQELHRVLRPGGKLAFVEHILDPHDSRNRRRQLRYQPLWSALTATCQVTRDTQLSIEKAGFRIGELVHEQMRVGPSIVRPVIRGWAERV